MDLLNIIYIEKKRHRYRAIPGNPLYLQNRYGILQLRNTTNKNTIL